MGTGRETAIHGTYQISDTNIHKLDVTPGSPDGAYGFTAEAGTKIAAMSVRDRSGNLVDGLASMGLTPDTELLDSWYSSILKFPIINIRLSAGQINCALNAQN